MKVSPIFIYLVIGTVGLIWVIAGKNVEIKKLKKQISLKESYIAENDVYVKTSLNLLKKPFWYVVNASNVSSLPKGEGEYIILTDSPLRARGNRLGVKDPDRNMKVNFLPNTSRSGAYTVEGGWLTYQYVD